MCARKPECELVCGRVCEIERVGVGTHVCAFVHVCVTRCVCVRVCSQVYLTLNPNPSNPNPNMNANAVAHSLIHVVTN